MSLDLHHYIHQPGVADGPTLVLLHGTGGDAASFLRFGRLLSPDAAMLSIQGAVSEQGAARFFRRMGEGVYDMEDLKRRTDDLADFLSAAFERYGVDPATAIGVGYSNGANILANLAFERPALLKKLALAHPLIPYEPPAVDLSGLNVLITAGRRDPICPPSLTDALEAALRGRGAGVSMVWRPGGHEIDGGEIEAIRSFSNSAAPKSG
ncbi:MAG: alpha/beta hydrolase [Rhodobacteraceae bacterium]|nr:alpha/beta hydrolase [Paracoccaceae bacterium]